MTTLKKWKVRKATFPLLVIVSLKLIN